eukprot:1183937-Prorocentrum_minimum.AAC.1
MSRKRILYSGLGFWAVLTSGARGRSSSSTAHHCFDGGRLVDRRKKILKLHGKITRGKRTQNKGTPPDIAFINFVLLRRRRFEIEGSRSSRCENRGSRSSRGEKTHLLALLPHHIPANLNCATNANKKTNKQHQRK